MIFQTISIVLFELQIVKLIKYVGKRTIKRAKLDLVFSENGRILKSRTSHIRELTRFQRKISSDSAVHHGRIASPGVPAPRKCMKSSRSLLYFAIYHSNRHLVGTVLAMKELSFFVADFSTEVWKREI